MIVYHGSTVIVDNPNLEILNFKTDFGKGFYTTTDIAQAKKWANIKKIRLQKEKNDSSIKKYISVFEYNEDNDLTVLNFSSATNEWLEFIYKNRQSDKLIHDYDVVIGPVANDNLYQVLLNYENGIYDKEETIKRLKTYTLSNQISFHTLKSLKYLKYIKNIEESEKNE